jgi:hypothetical protein
VNFGSLVSWGTVPVHYGSKTLMVGAEGFKLMYFHLVSCGINVLLSFIVFLILSLESFSWVCGRGLEVVRLWKVMYFGFILLNG